MDDYKIFYSCNASEGKMLKYLFYSILSARKYINKEDVLVYLHPPYNNENTELIDKIKKISKVTNLDDYIGIPYSVHPKSDPNNKRYFGEKLNVINVDSDIVIALDCDTFIYKDPIILLEGDYDFGANATDLTKTSWQSKNNLIEIMRRVYKFKLSDEIHLWNGGTYIFKNRSHKKIGKYWLDIFNNDRNTLDYCMKPNRKVYDQTALSVATAKYRLKLKTFSDKVISEVRGKEGKWSKDDIPEESVIVHGNGLADGIGMKEELDLFYCKLIGDSHD